MKFLRVLNFLSCVVFCYYAVSPPGTWMPENPSWSVMSLCGIAAAITAWIDSKIKNVGSGPKGPTRLA